MQVIIMLAFCRLIDSEEKQQNIQKVIQNRWIYYNEQSVILYYSNRVVMNCNNVASYYNHVSLWLATYFTDAKCCGYETS